MRLGRGSSEHWGEQVDPQEPGLAGADRRAELPGRVVAAAGGGAEQRDRAADQEAAYPGDRAGKPPHAQAEPDDEDDDEHADDLGAEQLAGPPAGGRLECGVGHRVPFGCAAQTAPAASAPSADPDSWAAR